MQLLNKMSLVVIILLKGSLFFLTLAKNASDRQQKKDQEIKEVKFIPSISLKNHYERIVAIVKNTIIIDQEEKNKIFVIY